MMTKLKKISAVFFLAALLGLPVYAQAQSAAPGTTGDKPKAATAADWLKEAEARQKAALEKGQGEKGGSYGVTDMAGDAISGTVSEIKNNANQIVQDLKDGNYGSAIANSVKGNIKIGLSAVGSIFKFIGNVKNVGQDVMFYDDPYTGERKSYIKTVFGGAQATQGVIDGCPPVPIQMIEDASCIFCPLFQVLYDAANEMATMSFEKLGGPMATVMLIGFGIFIAFKVLAHLSSLTKQDAPKFLGELLVQSFKVLIAFLLLMNSTQIYQYFISPVLGAGLEFGAAMLFENPTAFANCTSGINIANDTALLPITLYAKLDCFIRAIQAEIAVSQAIGSSLMCVGRNKGAMDIVGIWDFGMVFQGLIIWAFAVMLSLAFAFYLIDATVTLGLVGALMPFLIASWPFKLTNPYTKKGIDMFLNTFFVYVFMGIVVSINMQLIGQAMTNGQTTESVQTEGSSSTSTEASASGSPQGGGLTEIAKALSGDDIQTLKKLTDIGFGGFLILLCCCIFGFKFTQQATTLADKMASGGISGIGKNIGGMAAGGAAAVAKKATQPARQAVSNKANELTSRAGAAVGKKLGIGKHGGKTGDNKPAANNQGGGGGNQGGQSNNQNNNQNNNNQGGNNNHGGNQGGGNQSGSDTPNTRTNPNEGRDVAGGLDEARNGSGNS